MRAVLFSCCVVLLVSLVSTGPSDAQQIGLRSGKIQEGQFDVAGPAYVHQIALRSDNIQEDQYISSIGMKDGGHYRSKRRVFKNSDCKKYRRKWNKKDIQFLLYTPTSKSKPTRFTADTKNPVIKIKFSLPMIVVIHGFQEDAAEGTWMHDIKDEWMKRKSVNVILVDWSKLNGAAINYLKARCNVQYAGEHIAKLLKLLQGKGLSLSKTHIIGFSLGAHVAGDAGKRLNNKLGRITGLDPAGQRFHDSKLGDRLDKTDAKFVDVIHTSAGETQFFYIVNLLSGSFGYYGVLGHVDFYINGGEAQPGCDDTAVNPCSHGRAHQFYNECLKSPSSSYSFLCEDYENKKSTRSGSYKVNTNSNPPKGGPFLTPDKTKPIGPVKTKLKLSTVSTVVGWLSGKKKIL